MHEYYFIVGINTAIAALCLLVQYSARGDGAGHGWAHGRGGQLASGAGGDTPNPLDLH